MTRLTVIPRHSDSNGWWQTLPTAPAPNILRGSKRVRTAIIGGGICGVSTANRLADLCPGDDMCLIEAERIGFGASGRNAGFMLNLHSHGAPKDLKILRRNMKLWSAGLSSLRQKIESWQIQCDWSEAGRFYGAAGPDGEKHLKNIAKTLNELDQTYKLEDRASLKQRIGTEFYSHGLHADGNALVNPAALMRGLARHLPANLTVFEKTPVTEFNRDGDGYRITTPEGEVIADKVVLAAGVFLRQFGIAPSNFVPMATYASLTKPLGEAELQVLGSGKEFGLLGGSEIGATIRLTRDNRLFVRNYFDFRPGFPATGNQVEKIAQMHRLAMTKRWPSLANVPFEHSWGGIMAFTRNNGTVFGKYGPNLFAILTNDVSPMTRGEAAGCLLAEYIEGVDSDLLSLQMSIPGASRLPPRPFLDLGIKLHRARLNFVAGKEF
ncbi:FAD-binding oxidoreductase [Rhodobacteraceae bacterium KMM 6894]|nr:FAD-binding oxidoreductase [Rhodobacteraceae bacterium KMM 6894]